MEVYYYKCSACGYVHQVPAYWMSYAPEDEVEQMHFSPETRAVCPNKTLTFTGEGNED